jgi:hypothetical protein
MDLKSIDGDWLLLSVFVFLLVDVAVLLMEMGVGEKEGCKPFIDRTWDWETRGFGRLLRSFSWCSGIRKAFWRASITLFLD